MPGTPKMMLTGCALARRIQCKNKHGKSPRIDLDKAKHVFWDIGIDANVPNDILCPHTVPTCHTPQKWCSRYVPWQGESNAKTTMEKVPELT